MWVPGSGSWVFVEIGGLRNMSVGGSENLDFQRCLGIFFLMLFDAVKVQGPSGDDFK